MPAGFRLRVDYRRDRGVPPPPPPPPPPPDRAFGDFTAGLLSDSRKNLRSVDSAYYANKVYANTVDVCTPNPKNSARGRRTFKTAFAGFGAADQRIADAAGLFTGSVRRQMW